ncbi:DUF1822 family protein [Thermoleptolyngbya sichuanensis XZ-Cy5]|uniref:DUF1822 family protein n=1 Tax=Thermoleptolyngbya sichuanensis TaxID=2885951 RepID=UPI00240E32CD|nr:DUF1822 family protein [Thermoleptolyngbya sichuanensis]MDG2615531.1 DUF1822 family protein [Thermoleptolyngbya sichuanensis XZ-Cy5]
MTYNTAEIDDFALTLPLPQAARQLAQQFASQQPTPAKAEQVRHNTLAVWVVNDYLQMMGIDTDLERGDSWNAIARLAADVADLEVIGAGRLECRPVQNVSAPCPVPPEVWGDRIGYVAVHIDASQREASILGFTPTLEPGDDGPPALHPAHLQPPEDLMDHLDRLLHPLVATTLARAGVSLNQLGRWLQGAIDAGWSAVDAVLSPEQLSPAYAFRQLSNAAVRRAKLVEVGVSLPLVMELSLSTTQPGQTDICVQLYPSPGTPSLPPNVYLRILDESGTVFLEAQSTTLEDYLQLQFSGVSGETFGVQVALGDTTATEAFLI